MKNHNKCRKFIVQGIVTNSYFYDYVLCYDFSNLAQIFHVSQSISYKCNKCTVHGVENFLNNHNFLDFVYKV